MTVVEGWFGEIDISQGNFALECSLICETVRNIIVEQCSINRLAYLVYTDSGGLQLATPTIVGNKTEGSLINMIRGWGFDHDTVKKEKFSDLTDKIYSFNSDKKRSTAVVHRPDGSVRLYCKGASEWLLKDCSFYQNQSGVVCPMTPDMIQKLENKILNMAVRALRTLMLCHIDFKSAADLPVGWEENPPDDKGLCCDCIVGIIGKEASAS